MEGIKITLFDGTSIEHLTENGSCFISNDKIDESVFADNLSKVTIHRGKNAEELKDMELAGLWREDGKTWIALRQLSEDEILHAKIHADIEYLAMMTGTQM